MGQGAAPEQPTAHAGRLPPRLRLLAHVAPAGQRGVERAGLQIDYLRCGQVSVAAAAQDRVFGYILDNHARLVAGTVLIGQLFVRCFDRPIRNFFVTPWVA